MPSCRVEHVTNSSLSYANLPRRVGLILPGRTENLPLLQTEYILTLSGDLTTNWSTYQRQRDDQLFLV